MAALLEVRGLTVEVEGKRILKGVNLSVDRGEIHLVMGPNGSGKSTLAYAITGRPGYEVVDGDILFEGRSILEMDPDERALAGIFLGFQEPPPIPGVRLLTLYNAVSNKKQGKPIAGYGDPTAHKRVAQALEAVGLPASYALREVNVGFSGGEKKRLEAAQALLFDPKLVIMDEPDSGLDADGVRQIAGIFKRLRDDGKALIIITHYARLAKFLEPDRVTVLVGGRVAATGGPDLAHLIESEGYSRFTGGN